MTVCPRDQLFGQGSPKIGHDGHCEVLAQYQLIECVCVCFVGVEQENMTVKLTVPCSHESHNLVPVRSLKRGAGGRE